MTKYTGFLGHQLVLVASCGWEPMAKRWRLYHVTGIGCEDVLRMLNGTNVDPDPAEGDRQIPLFSGCCGLVGQDAEMIQWWIDGQRFLGFP